MFVKDSRELVQFFGYDAMANLFIEKARACSYLPPSFNVLGDLEYYLECEKQAHYIDWLKNDPQVPFVVKQYAQDLQFQKNYDKYIFDLFQFETPLFHERICEGSSKPDSGERSLSQLAQLEDCLKQDNLLRYIGNDVPYRKFSITLKSRYLDNINYLDLEKGIRDLYTRYVNIVDDSESKTLYSGFILELSFKDDVDSCIVPELFDFGKIEVSFNAEVVSWRDPDLSWYSKQVYSCLVLKQEGIDEVKTKLGSALKLLAGV